MLLAFKNRCGLHRRQRITNVDFAYVVPQRTAETMMLRLRGWLIATIRGTEGYPGVEPGLSITNSLVIRISVI